MKKTLALVLALCMALSCFAALAEETAEATYTYKSYSTALGSNWNPHSWETNADDAVNSYITSPFVTMSILDSENGVYQWVYEMATSVTDVTAEHQDDLTKYNVTLQEGKTAADTTEGFVFEIKLNENAKWQDGTPINADSYIYSMKQLLDSKMKNYRANLYYAGESAVAGGLAYYNSGSDIYAPVVPAYGEGDTPDYSYDINTKDAYLKLDATTTFTSSYSINDLVDMGYVTEDLSVLKSEGNSLGYIKLTEANKPTILAALDQFCAAFGISIYSDEAKTVVNEEYLKEFLFCITGQGEVVDYDSTVGCYKVDDYTIRYVNAQYIDFNYFLTSLTSNWLVKEDIYEANKEMAGDLVTTKYGTSLETSSSYGPYMIESLQPSKQIVYTRNPNWYGYEKDENGKLVAYTNYLVDGETRQRYITDKIVIDIMDEAAAKQAFMKGELSDWNVPADDLITYATSEQLYKVDETYTMSLFFNTGLENLKTMDASKGNTNSVVLSNINFRNAMSLAFDRAEYVTATEGFKPAYSLMNGLYHYDIYNDPYSSYRSSEPAMQAICNLYNVAYGEGTPYATLKDAYQSINGYNLTQAKELFKKACDELVAEGLYKAGDPIHIRMGWAKGALQASDLKIVEILNNQLAKAMEGSGFGTLTLEPIGNINDRYGDVPAGEYAIGYGAWGGAAFYPFRNMQVYCDTDQYEINEAGCWDPAVETATFTVNGVEDTMSWKDWSGALVGSGKYTAESNQTKLEVTAQMEEAYLKKYYRIPLAATTIPSMLSYQCYYYTEDYNIMYGFGGLELMGYNYNDAEWAAFVAEQGGTLNYE